MKTKSQALRVGAIALGVILGATLVPAAAAARPDLVVSGPRAASKVATAGGGLAVSAKIMNTGSGN